MKTYYTTQDGRRAVLFQAEYGEPLERVAFEVAQVCPLTARRIYELLDDFIQKIIDIEVTERTEQEPCNQ